MAKNGDFSRLREWECQEAHVLVVDDSPVDRKIIERMLKITCCSCKGKN